MTRRADIDIPCAPRCFRREEAARYVGLSPTTFNNLVQSHEMPQPIKINSVVLWDRLALDAKIDELTHNDNDAGDWK